MGFPTDVRTAAHALLVATVAANPSWSVVASGSSRPASVAPLHVWVDDIRFDIVHDSGLRQWRAEVDVWVCYSPGDNEQGQARADLVLTGVLDAFDADPHWPDPADLGGAIHQGAVRVRSGAVAVNAVEVPAYVVTFADVTFQEGRTGA